MHTNHDGERQELECDDMTGDAHERPTASRRRLLTGTGGLALAASGLFLPDWLAETEAREGALGGDKGGRRGNDRKGRDQKRDHRNNRKKNKNKSDAPRGAGPLFRSTALTVVNKGSQPLQCTFFYRTKTGLDDYGAPIANGTRTVNPGASYRYDPDRYRVGVLLAQVLGPDDIYADVRNVSFFYPRGGVTTGKSLDPAGGNVGASLIEEANFFEGEEKQGQNVVLQRLTDDSQGAKRIEWQVIIR